MIKSRICSFYGGFEKIFCLYTGGKKYNREKNFLILKHDRMCVQNSTELQTSSSGWTQYFFVIREEIDPFRVVIEHMTGCSIELSKHSL